MTSIEWTATGGIALNGTYSSRSTVALQVVAKRRGPNWTMADRATGTVVQPQASIVAVVISPASATVVNRDAADLQHDRQAHR